VPLPARTAAKLKELRAESIHVLPANLVFCYEDGSRLGATWFTKRFAGAMGLEGIDTKGRCLRPHSFRHSLNTLLRDAGYSDEKIRAAMGWTNARTQAGYTHWKVEHLRDQAKIIDGIWG
jgi:integrase